jgi:methyltransferase (TIGR00027 family)
MAGRIPPPGRLGKARGAPTSSSMEPVAYTANWVAAARARESDRADALFHDPFAAALAGDEGARWIAVDDDGQVEAYVALRTRFFDDELLRAARLRGIRQVVILAAGLDARAYRLPFPAGTHLFELDQPEVLAHKEAVLAAAHAEPRCVRESLGVDLRLPWEDALRHAGFSPSEPSAWLVEGLLPYLREADVRRLFTRVSTLAVAGSTLALDVAGTRAFSSPTFAPHLDRMRARGIDLHFTCDEPVALLDAFGWSAEDHTLEELSARSGRALPDRDAGMLFDSHCVAASRQAA